MAKSCKLAKKVQTCEKKGQKVTNQWKQVINQCKKDKLVKKSRENVNLSDKKVTN